MSRILDGILATVTQRAFLHEKRIRGFVGENDVRTAARDWKEKVIRAFYQDNSTRKTAIPLPDLRALLLLTSETQQNWLVADRMTAYCVVDDRNWEKPQVKFTAGLDSMLPVEADATWSDAAGVLRFGGRPRNWLYSKDLFLNEPISEVVTRFLTKVHADHHATG